MKANIPATSAAHTPTVKGVTKRVLILMRHGKSAYPDGVDDHDRPLADRGRREAGIGGDWMRSSQPQVDLVLCSTATRTRETLAATGIKAPVSFEPSIYGGSPHELIDLVREVTAPAETILLIGHAPGIPWTGWELANNRNSLAAGEMSQAYPTSAIAVLEFECDWAELGPGTGELVRFHVPR
jgi:phosphohistidine phosphatase